MRPQFLINSGGIKAKRNDLSDCSFRKSPWIAYLFKHLRHAAIKFSKQDGLHSGHLSRSFKRLLEGIDSKEISGYGVFPWPLRIRCAKCAVSKSIEEKRGFATKLAPLYIRRKRWSLARGEWGGFEVYREKRFLNGHPLDEDLNHEKTKRRVKTCDVLCATRPWSTRMSW